MNYSLVNLMLKINALSCFYIKAKSILAWKYNC